MIGYVSGESRRGALIKMGECFGYSLDDGRELKLKQSQLAHFFAHARDVEEVGIKGKDDLLGIVQQHFLRDRALRLVLIALDSTFSSGLREQCAIYAEELLATADIRQFVEYRLYAVVLPETFSHQAVSDFLASITVPIFEEIIDLLLMRQGSIASCIAAWEELPDSVFASLDRAEARARVAKVGAFYDFAVREDSTNNTLFSLLADPVMRGRAETREIVIGWASRYKAKPRSGPLEYRSETSAYAEMAPVVNGFQAFQQVKKQLKSIKDEMAANNTDKAERLVEELVRFQKHAPEFLSKSLCDLASFAKGLGDIDKSIELARRAVEYAPDDAWAHVQLANALLSKGDFPAAATHFKQGQVFGDERAYLLGMAELYKHVGQRREAITAIEDCLTKFPNDEVAQNSRAAILAHYGDLEAALDAYSQIIENSLPTLVAFCGKAAVLHDLGRYEEALRSQEIGLSLTKDDPIAHVGMADMLRERGNYVHAWEILSGEQRQPRWRLQFGLARSRILRDKGDFAGCLTLLERLQLEFPNDSSAFSAGADLHRKCGRFEEAMSIYEAMEARFDNLRMPRLAIAATLAAVDRDDEALSYIPDRFESTRGDWIGLHIRGMIELKRGRFDLALTHFLRGLEDCPWKQQSVYFRAGVALVELRRKQYPAALDVVEKIEPQISPALVSGVGLLKAHAAAGMRGTVFEIGHYIASNSLLSEIVNAPHSENEPASAIAAEWTYFMALAA